jgi:hypothetical protein
MFDPGCGARCAIRDTGARGEGRYHWTVTVFEYGRRLGTPLIPAAELRFTIAAGRLRFGYGTGERLVHVECAFEIDRQDLPPNLGIGIQDVADAPDASAVDHSAYAPPTTTIGRGRYSEPPWAYCLSTRGSG